MANRSWWGFDDASIDFGAITAPAESLTTSVMAGFAMRYGNDHFLVPVPLNVPSILGQARRFEQFATDYAAAFCAASGASARACSRCASPPTTSAFPRCRACSSRTTPSRIRNCPCRTASTG